MSVARVKGLVPVLAVGAMLAGCGSQSEYYAPEPDPYYQRVLEAGREAPVDEGETALLAQLSDLPPNQPATLGAWVFVPGDTYVAASGSLCRRLVQGASGSSAGSRSRVACTDQTEWFFVPDVIGAEADSSDEP